MQSRRCATGSEEIGSAKDISRSDVLELFAFVSIIQEVSRMERGREEGRYSGSSLSLVVGSHQISLATMMTEFITIRGIRITVRTLAIKSIVFALTLVLS